MAIKKKPKPTFTLDDKRKAVAAIKKRLAGTGRLLERFNKLSEAKQLEAGEKALKKYAKRNKAGAIEWESFFASLLKFLEGLMKILGPFLFPTVAIALAFVATLFAPLIA